jgi:Reverse transcriptase (RNA-dependent DNA polymerase)
MDHHQTPSPQVNVPPLRRSNRQRNAPNRLGYDGEQGRGYFANLDYLDFHWHNYEASEDAPTTMPYSYKASVSDPDTLSFDEAMRDVEDVAKWFEAAGVEISALEKNGTWIEVPISEATTRILPGTWVFKRKRTPDGVVFKYKARYCVRGDLQETVEDTFAPVVAWGTVRLFLVLSITLQWNTCTIDFSNAFVQATLNDPVWIHLPRGFTAQRGPNTCLRLKKSLYGLSVAPRLWYEHLSEALREDGFVPCSNDRCLLHKATILIVIYVDDVGIAYSNQNDLDGLFDTLTKKGFTFTKEGTFEAFLGIKFERDPEKGTLTLTQKGLIQKIKEATGMGDGNCNWTPASQVALGIDPDGPAMQETWSYRSIVGMLLYLSTNTRPDISFAVSQVARFSHNPKKSHASAIKSIIRYLNRTSDKGMIIKPTGNLAIDCYVDADFAGLHGRDPDRSPSSAKSRTGYIITLGGCPIVWKSHLQSEITLSTLEAEYSALSSAMRTLLPLRAMLVEIIAGIKLPHTFEATVRCQVFEDNNGALLLATNQRITNRTKYFQVKWHFFWAHVRDGTIVIVKVDTLEQWADYLTKGLNRESFERVRKLVQGW